MKTKNFVIISFACLLQLACGKTSVKKIIDNGSYRYWRMSTTEIYDYLYYFEDDGKWTIFEGYSKEPFTKYTDLEEYDGGDYMLTKTWRLENDSIIYINGSMDFHVTILYDTIMLLKCEFRTDTLYAVPRKRIPEKFRKKYDFNNKKRNFIIG